MAGDPFAPLKLAAFGAQPDAFLAQHFGHDIVAQHFLMTRAIKR